MRLHRITLGNILTALGLVACSPIGSTVTAAEPVKNTRVATKQSHQHAQEGPHHGQVIELGSEDYHAELVHDEKAHKVSIYLLNSDLQRYVVIPEKELRLNLVVGGKPTQFLLPAVPQSIDPAGKASRFELVDKKLEDALHAHAAKGRLNVAIGGKSYVGEISGHSHGHRH